MYRRRKDGRERTEDKSKKDETKRDTREARKDVGKDSDRTRTIKHGKTSRNRSRSRDNDSEQEDARYVQQDDGKFRSKV